MSKVIETSTAEISLLPGNIVKMKFKQDVDVTLEEIKENHEAAKKITNGKKHFVLLDVRGYITGSDKARAFCASKTPVPYRMAVAAIVDSLAVRLRTNSYIKFNKPVIPTRIFSEEEKAIEWLKKFSLE